MLLIEIDFEMRPVGWSLRTSFPGGKDEIDDLEEELARDPCLHSFRKSAFRKNDYVQLQIRMWSQSGPETVASIRDRVGRIAKPWELVRGTAFRRIAIGTVAGEVTGSSCLTEIEIEERLALVRKFHAARRSYDEAYGTLYFDMGVEAVADKDRCKAQLDQLLTNPTIGKLFAYHH